MLLTEKKSGLLSSITIPVIIVAIFTALFHIAPYIAAKLQTPSEIKFTGNLVISPDVMQYRVWSRRTQTTGPLVDNTFTNEPNKPHLLVIYYYVNGKIASLLGQDPEHVFYYTGAFLAFIFTIVLFATINHFIRSRYQTWWCFAVVLIGGGIGPFFLLVENFDFVNNNYFLKTLIVQPFEIRDRLIFEGYRGHYILTTLIDHHYLMIWLITLLAIVSLYFTLKKFSFIRVLLTAVFYAAATLIHLYEGVTLIMITLGIVFFFYKKKLDTRAGLITASVCIISVAACFCWHFHMYRSSGLTISPWRAQSILVTTLLLAYPLAWLMIFIGIIVFYREADFNDCFLLGWAFGCLVLILSGPFYPYPDRGAITLQIPLYLIAGKIYFSRHNRITWPVGIVVVLILGVSPAWILRHHWVQYNGYDPFKPFAWMSEGHCDIADELQNKATEDDVLLVDKSPPDWATDDLWLAPYHPGKLFCGHFFLTPRYDERRTETTRFFKSNDPNEQIAFLEGEKIRFIYVNAQVYPSYFEKQIYELDRIESIPGVSLIKSTSVGSLFEYSGNSQNAAK